MSFELHWVIVTEVPRNTKNFKKLIYMQKQIWPLDGAFIDHASLNNYSGFTLQRHSVYTFEICIINDKIKPLPAYHWNELFIFLLLIQI